MNNFLIDILCVVGVLGGILLLYTLMKFFGFVVIICLIGYIWYVTFIKK
jgi:hypothetical protein